MPCTNVVFMGTWNFNNSPPVDSVSKQFIICNDNVSTKNSIKNPDVVHG